MGCFTATCIFLGAMNILQPVGVDKKQAFCLAMNIYHEARGETLAGQVQVAHTTIARVNDTRFPGNICGVVNQRSVNSSGVATCAFSWTCNYSTTEIYFDPNDNRSMLDMDSFKIATVISLNIIGGYLPDMCDGANYYYNPSLASPNWGRLYNKKCVIDSHVFLKREIGSEY